MPPKRLGETDRVVPLSVLRAVGSTAQVDPPVWERSGGPDGKAGRTLEQLSRVHLS